MSHETHAIAETTMSATTVMKMRMAGASIPEVSARVRARLWY